MTAIATRRTKLQPEYQLQTLVCRWLIMQHPSVLFLSDVRAAVKLTIPQQMRLKKLQKPSFACPDLMLFAPNRHYAGMFLELKASSPYKRNGELRTDDHLHAQWASITHLRELGYHADFYWDYDQISTAINEYLREVEKP